MAGGNQYFLNEKDKERILAALTRLDNTRQDGITPYVPPGDPRAPEVYVGILPCGEEIPKREGDTPGVAKVCLYKMVGTAAGQPIIGPGGVPEEEPETPPDDSPGQTYKLEPVVDLQDPPVQIRVDVYNIYDEPVTDGEHYIRLQRDKYGRWLNERPQDSAPPPAVTNDSINPIENACTGICVWVWDELAFEWVPDQENANACSNPPGTTQTTEDPCAAMASSGDCSCCPGIDPYTNTSTTAAPTTTTLDPDEFVCVCQYPLHCGITDQEITETSCSVGENTPDLDCTTTLTTGDPDTTTTPDCNCDTSTTLGQCGNGCDWKAVPVWMGGGGWAWANTSNDCAPHCPCPYPDKIPDCNTDHTNCVPLPPPGPPGPAPPCQGGCHFIYTAVGGNWILIDHDCSQLAWCHGVWASNQGDCCTCVYPSYTGQDCEQASTGCVMPPANSTTQDPCAPCYSSTTTPGPTTSSTTTSCNPCSACTYPDEKCCYNYSTECEQWVLVLDLCEPEGCVDCKTSLDDAPPFTSGSGFTKCIPCSGVAPEPPPDPCEEEGAKCDTGTDCARCKWKWSCDCDPPAWVEIQMPCEGNCPCSYPDYECNRSYTEWERCGSDPSMTIETTEAPVCNQVYSNFCLSQNTSTTLAPTTTTTAEPTTTDTTITTCDPTTTAPPVTPAPTTTECPTSTTTTATSTTSTSCNPAPGCSEPVDPNYPCGNPPFDPAFWSTCCCHGPCCVYAKNPDPVCFVGEGAFMNCTNNSTVWHCNAEGGACCDPDGAEECDVYFLGEGYTCEDCPEGWTGITSTTTTPSPETGACCWDHGEECTDGLTYGACSIKDDSIEWRQDTFCASFTCPTTLQPDEGACCYNYGSCTPREQVNCQGAGELWYEDKRCDQVDCPTTIAPGDGACCYDNGSCNVETQVNCQTRPGFDEWHDGVGCAAVTCPPCDCSEEACTYIWTCDPFDCAGTGSWSIYAPGDNSCTDPPGCNETCECTPPSSPGSSPMEQGSGTCINISP